MHLRRGFGRRHRGIPQGEATSTRQGDDGGAAPPSGATTSLPPHAGVGRRWWRSDMAVQVLLPFHKGQRGDGGMSFQQCNVHILFSLTRHLVS
jgi:hypothetical protein